MTPSPDRPLSAALRAWWTHMRRAQVVGVMLAIAALLIASGPFGTIGFPLEQRALYWAVILWGSYSLGYLLWHGSAQIRAAHRPWIGAVGFAVANGLAVTLFVAAAHRLLRAGAQGTVFDTLGFWAQLWGVATLVSGLLVQLRARAQGSSDAPPAGPLLLERLAPPLRGPLVALSAEDHYTRIRTTKGQELILMPLRDAILQASPTKGLQIHRSHWVATGHIAQVQRSGGKTRVVLTDGTELPVSRGNTAQLRELGF